MKRSKFSLSHYKLMSMKMGFLVPCGLVEVLPGDTFQHSTSALVRVAPLVAPVMHPVHVRVHHWFVPHRLVWDGWEDFITGGPDGLGNGASFPRVGLSTTEAGVGTLADYLGVPPEIELAADKEVSALPFRGYALIWNEWYRDQDLQPELTIDKTSGGDASTSTLLQRVAWEKDYFTSARPWTQKGPEVTIPLSGNAPVVPQGSPAYPTMSGDQDAATTVGVVSDSGLTLPGNTSGSAKWVNPALEADLSNVTAANINDLRLAMALQRYEEARARYGSRYTEYLRYLGVRSSDARLQRPEYLGGGKQTIQFSEVLQTGPNDPASGQIVGDLKGHGIGAMRSNRYRRFFEEHGYVFSLMSVKPRTMYTQGVARTWNRRVKEDFWQRELQHIGQQEILNKELYIQHSNQAGVFGYQDRYDEYRRMESSVAGEFRTEALDYWHLARTFGAEPVLNGSFVESVPTDRIFADQSGADTLYVMAAHSIQARRMVAKTGTSFIF